MRTRVVYRNKPTSIISIVLLVLSGTLFLIIGAIVLSNRMSLAKNGIAVEATVIGLEEHYSKRAGTQNKNKTTLTYRPKIEFTTSDGQKIRLVYPNGSNPPQYSIGDKINIIYSEDNPENIVIDSKFQIYIFPIIFVVLGAVLLISGIGFTVVRLFR